MNYGKDPVLDQCETWFANPNGGKIPVSFDPVKPPPSHMLLWQWTDDSDGKDSPTKKFGGIDFNAFDGTADELLAKFKIVPQPPGQG